MKPDEGFGPGVFGESGQFGDFATRNPDMKGALGGGKAMAFGDYRVRGNPPPLEGPAAGLDLQGHHHL